MVVLARIDDPAVIHRILRHLGLSNEPEERQPSEVGDARAASDLAAEAVRLPERASR